MNVLVLGARTTGTAVVEEMVDAFLGARFSGEERHVRRLAKTQAIEDRYMSRGKSSKQALGRGAKAPLPRPADKSPTDRP
jgi:ribose 5-phosphate isomerase B